MSMREEKLILVSESERLPLRVGSSVLYYRRLSLGALAGMERSQAVQAPGGEGGQARVFTPPAALEAAIVAHALVGWEGVYDPINKQEVPFSPLYAGRLPAGVRKMLLAKAKDIKLPV